MNNIIRNWRAIDLGFRFTFAADFMETSGSGLGSGVIRISTRATVNMNGGTRLSNSHKREAETNKSKSSVLLDLERGKVQATRALRPSSQSEMKYFRLN
ncbi:hypothetical protein HanXRQr2_Chr14g0627031 [Helianthus annuus]|uniref:Uncharacterized protein n=1 Tax=Helianthus annuus TaxID=4232 RepID=A0A9K3E7L2_HELAN|nr:hypothetical protein HanXRQr2_Chr14g0627031 [Helianthus annuus]KAJ0839017.1 hypothetical protein HanPSC8_Chr14g0601781 [Helianthus annuus]